MRSAVITVTDLTHTSSQSSQEIKRPIVSEDAIRQPRRGRLQRDDEAPFVDDFSRETHGISTSNYLSLPYGMRYSYKMLEFKKSNHLPQLSKRVGGFRGEQNDNFIHVLQHTIHSL